MQLVAHCGRSMVRGAIRCRIRRCRRPFFLRWECVLPRNLQISVPSPCRVHDETRGAQTPTREGFSSRRLSSRLPSTHSSNVLCGLRCSSRKSLHTLDEKATTQSHPNLQCSPWSHRVRHHVVDVHAFQSLHLSQVSSTSVSAKRLKVRVATYMESARRQTCTCHSVHAHSASFMWRTFRVPSVFLDRRKRARAHRTSPCRRERFLRTPLASTS